MRGMKTALLASAITLLASGCVCGAYNGAGDKVYARGSESMILCSNGGFVANLSSGSVEGRFMQDASGAWIATRGDDGQLAFDFSYAADGSLDAPQLGDAAWAPKSLDQTALDHADVQCTDLETRAWWTAE
jgi:hypothetical protein